MLYAKNKNIIVYLKKKIYIYIIVYLSLKFFHVCIFIVYKN